MQLPLISIIVCTYNGEKFLKEQLDSLLAQTYPRLEIIISDDCSTDRTKEILAEYSNRENIRIIFRKINAGFSKNFYETALLAKGEFIAFADQDDICFPKKIECLHKVIDNYFLVFGNSEMINENGSQLDQKLSDLRRMSDEYDTKGFFLDNIAWGHTFLIRKELMNYYEPSPQNVEYDKWLAVIATCLSGIKYLDEPLTFYRQHNKTISQTSKDVDSTLTNPQKRFKVFEKNLLWLHVLKNNPLEKNQNFYKKFFDLYKLKEKGYFVWKLFFFLLQNEKDIFKFRRKTRFQNFIEIRKMARGEKRN